MKKYSIVYRYSSLVFFFSLLLLSAFSYGQKGYTSWLPAPDSQDAMLLGNGTSAAMVYGHPHTEKIIINHSSLYLPTSDPVKPIDMKSILPDIRQLIVAGDGTKAAQLIVDKSLEEGYGGQIWSDPYVPAYDLAIHITAENIENYQRSVNFETGEALVKWTQNGNHFIRSQFISRADSILVIKITAEKPFDVEFIIDRHPVAWDQWDFINSNFKNTAFFAKGTNLYYQSQFVHQWEGNVAGYEGVCKLITPGEVTTNAHSLTAKNTTEVLFFNKVSSFKTGETFSTKEIENYLNSLPTNYNTLLEAHKAIHTEMFNRISVDLGGTEDDMGLDAEVMMRQSKEAFNNAFIEKQFYASRYNILSATGSTPPNLQGIWAPSWTPPWSSDYTNDGNLPTAISSYLVSNMPELMMSYFNYHDNMLPYYRDNAKMLYGCRGIQVPSHSSSYGWNNHFDPTWCLLFWNGGAAWASHFYYDYWLYTKDKAFLKERAYPFMKETALFYKDFLSLDENGEYLFNPSYSPENNPANNPSQATINATMDVAMAKEVLRNLIEAGKILHEEKAQLADWQTMLDKLPDYEVDSTGTFREWLYPGYTENHNHRHLSHLYGMYDIIDPEIAANPELWDGVKKALYERMKVRRQDNGGIMVFGMVQMAWVAANLGDAEMVQEILGWLSAQYWSNSLATFHDPNGLFNMDLSGGFQTAVIRSLVYSEPGYISLLPAKPPKWETGSLKGVLARNLVTINNLSWNKQQVLTTISSVKAQSILLQLPKNAQGVEVASTTGILKKYNKNTNQAIIELQADKKIELVINLR